MVETGVIASALIYLQYGTHSFLRLKNIWVKNIPGFIGYTRSLGQK
jgi:hypothetical protein